MKSTTENINVHAAPSEVLYDMKGYMTARHELFNKGIWVGVVLVLSAPINFLMAVVFGVLGLTSVAFVLMHLVPIALLVGLTLWALLYFIIFPDVVKNQKILYRVKKEIFRRGKCSFSFVLDN